MSDAPLSPGTRVGRFILRSQLGEGGMGVVYAAHDPQLDRAVAVKVLRGRVGGGQPLRLLREAQALARLAHPNVVGVHDVGVHEDRIFLAMELVEGTTLDVELAARPRSWRALLALFVQAGRGLAAVHDKGLIHRDVKPSNIFVDGEGRARIGDFGLARLDPTFEPGPVSVQASASRADPGAVTIDAPGDLQTPAPPSALRSDATVPSGTSALLGTPLTRDGAVVGTPGYMAPEQLAGGTVTRQADQYAFCVTLWQALWGEHPFPDGEGPRRPAPRRRNGVPASVESALARGLASDPAARWPSMVELLEALERATARRRRAVLASAALGIGMAAAAGGVVVANSVHAQPACERAADRIAGLWTPTARDGIRQAFAATDLPFAADTATRSIELLQAWTGRWAELRVDTCRATHDRGEQSAALLDRRVACQDGQLAAFDALLTRLGHADAKVVQRALDAVALLPGPDICAAAGLAGATPVPTDPRVGEIERELGAARAGRDLKAADAGPHAEQAVTLARALGDPGLRARALTMHAMVTSSQDPAGARKELEEAQSDAATARDPGAEADAMLAMLTIVTEAADADRIEALLPVARAAVTRAGAPRTLGIRLVEAEEAAFVALGQLEEAQQACDQLIGLARGAQASATRSQCACVIPLRARSIGAAVKGCEQHLADERAWAGSEHPRVVRAATRLVIALNRAGRSREAIVLARENLARAERIFGAVSTDVARELQNTSTVQDALGEIAASRTSLERALSIYQQLGAPPDFGRVGILCELADRASTLEDQAAAIRYADECLALAEKVLGPDNRELPNILVRHAESIMEEPAQRARALVSFQRAVALAEKSSGPNSGVLSASLSAEANFLYKTGRAAMAVPLAERAAAIVDQMDGVDPMEVAARHELFGNVLVAAGKHRQARKPLERARAIYAAAGEPELLRQVEQALARTGSLTGDPTSRNSR
jgi:eukaryotic-like serine/threonine-protein kinase